MNATHSPYRSARRPWITSTLAATVIGLCWPYPAGAQTLYQTQSGEKLLFESSGATRLVEKVRSASQGVMVAVFVKPGDSVRKGQLLGNTDLDATKLQLDLARHAMLAKGNVDSAKNQADAWKIAREETQEAVRRRKAEETRLEWAVAMEKMYQSNYEGQLDAEEAQRIQYEYWRDQYEKRFFHAPIDGVVTEVLVDVGKQVGIATHLFTISNESTYALPVAVPTSVADAAVAEKSLPVRSADGKSVGNAQVDSVTDDPRETGRKIIRLLVKAAEFPAAIRPKLPGMKFDVLLPPSDQNASR